MKTAIIASKSDQASVNIKEHIDQLNLPKDTSLYFFDKETVELENIDKEIDADFFIFVSKHQSKNPRDMLTTHVMGNFSDDISVGGQPKQLIPGSATALLNALILQKEAAEKIGFEFFQEVTHHGPFLNKPGLFLEIGCDLKAWQNKPAGKLVAENSIKLAEDISKYNSWEEYKNNYNYKTAIGIGGLHHANNFQRLSTEQNIAFSHICPKYMLDHLNKETVQQMIDKTVEPINLIIVDWKGVGHHKEKIKQILDDLGLKWHKIRELKSK